MKGDFTRRTFKPEKHYNSVLMQQGRVQLDADWNEQVQIELYRDRTITGDLVGPSGVPKGNTVPPYQGFQIEASGNDLIIRRGNFYVNGVLCRNDSDTFFKAQADFPSPPAATTGQQHLIYLEAFDQHVTAIDDPDIQEVALGGPDTATRIKTVWQVKALPLGAGVTGDCSSDFGLWNQLQVAPTGQLFAQALPAAVNTGTDPCVVPSGSGYRGLENQLYRVEVHNGGALSAATFKWSRENGAVTTAIEELSVGSDPTKVKVKSLGRDQATRLQVGMWVEVVDQAKEVKGEIGDMRKITAIDEVQRVVTFETAITGSFSINRRPKLRRWEAIAASAVITTSSSWVELESGVQIKFTAGSYRTGDYWMIPARVVTGQIDWPKDGGGSPLAVAPHGVEHNYAKLALAAFNGTSWANVLDCRKIIPPLTDLATYFFYVSGDGQEVLPGQQLGKPLQVGVTNRQKPIKGARVRFKITDPAGTGAGGLTPDTGYASEVIVTGREIVVIADANGIASCKYTPYTTQDIQQVEAVLLPETGNVPTHLPPVRFNCNLSRASDVAYTPPLDCDKFQGAVTVQQALDQLCECECGATCEPGLVIQHIMFIGNGMPLIPGASVPINFLQPGIRVITQLPPGATIQLSTLKQYTAYVVVYLPYPIMSDDVAFWGNNFEFGMQPIMLHGTLSVVGPEIIWQPTAEAQTKLSVRLMSLASVSQVLMQFVLNGNYIWAQNGAQLFYLSSNLFGMHPITPTGFHLKFGIDGCPGGGLLNLPFYLVDDSSGATTVVTSLSFVPNPVVGGNPSVATVTLNRVPPTPATITIDAVDPSKRTMFNPVLPRTFLISSPNSNGTISLGTNVLPGSTASLVTLSAVTGATPSVTNDLTINPQSKVLTFDVEPTTVVGPNATTGTVTLTFPAPTGGSLVAIGSSNTNAADPMNTTVPAGQINHSFSIPTKTVPADTSTTLTASLNGGSDTANLAVLGSGPAVSLSDFIVNMPVVVGGSPINATVVLTAPAPTGGTQVAIDSQRRDITNTAPFNVTVAAGQTQHTFNIPTVVVSQEESFQVSAALGTVTLHRDVTVQPAGDKLKVVELAIITAGNEPRYQATAPHGPITTVPETGQLFEHDELVAIELVFNGSVDTQVSQQAIVVTRTAGPGGPVGGTVMMTGPNSVRFLVQNPTQFTFGTYTVSVKGSGPNAIRSMLGEPLDGSPTSLPSGDGTAGGDFNFTLQIAAG